MVTPKMTTPVPNAFNFLLLFQIGRGDLTEGLYPFPGARPNKMDLSAKRASLPHYFIMANQDNPIFFYIFQSFGFYQNMEKF
jgi:hypothetical protein